jgi:hypothetical protein
MSRKEYIVMFPIERRGWCVAKCGVKVTETGLHWWRRFDCSRTVPHKEQALHFARFISQQEDLPYYRALDNDRDLAILAREVANDLAPC